MIKVQAKLLNPKILERLPDWLAIGVAISLPWSTSATSILIALWLVAILVTLHMRAVRRELATAAGGLPVCLWLLAALGSLWATVPWVERLGGLDGFHRLLVIPLLLAQFRRSPHGLRVLYGFLFSATCLATVSWGLALTGIVIPGKSPGVPVKDYISQSGLFLLCGFALIGAVFEFWRTRQARTSLWLVVPAAVFLANIALVATSRTTLFVAPVLAGALGYRQLGVRGLVAGGLALCLLGGVAYHESPYLRTRINNSLDELRAYREANAANPTGQHLEYLKKSWRIVAGAPLVGHGTGSIPEEFRHAKVGETGAASEAPVNPHNQIFAISIQLGLLGAAVLLAMWIAHLMLFRGQGLVAWIGLLLVVQNMASSMVNSHLFDFTQGWLYVFGVGVTGGMVLRHKDSASHLSPNAPR
jgi:O-antigen ligase